MEKWKIEVGDEVFKKMWPYKLIEFERTINWTKHSRVQMSTFEAYHSRRPRGMYNPSLYVLKEISLQVAQEVFNVLSLFLFLLTNIYYIRLLMKKQ